jgi:hypothetical protein
MSLHAAISISAAAALLTIAPFATAAGTLSGYFVGTASNSRCCGQGASAQTFDGETITGSFDIDLSSPPVSTPRYAGATRYYADALTLTFTAHGRTVTYDEASLVTITEQGSFQQLTFSQSPEPYSNASLTLTGNLLDNLDPTTLRAGEIDLSRSSTSFYFSREFGANVNLTSLSFTSPVPEPSTYAFMAMGILGVIFTTSGKARRRSKQVSA